MSETEPTDEELQALFDKLEAENKAEEAPAAAPAPAAAETTGEASDDELQALFDKLESEKKAEEAPAAAPAPTPAPAAAEATGEASDEELQALFDKLESEKKAEEAPAATDDPIVDSSKPLYDQIGGVLRQLHDSMCELGYDRSLQDVASDVTDAKGRLEYVATLTEQAATRVLNSIDLSMPQQEALSKEAKDIEERWNKLFEGNMDVEAFKQLAKDSQAFAAATAAKAEEEKARLLEMMMAQDFQDITGQVIKRVVTISQKLEKALAQILRDNAPPEAKEKVVDLMSGPDVPGKALDQDDVDGLLATLGF